MTSGNEILQIINLNYFENQLQLYLYNHQSINFSDNRKIHVSTIKYIRTQDVSQLNICFKGLLCEEKSLIDKT